MGFQFSLKALVFEIIFKVLSLLFAENAYFGISFLKQDHEVKQ